jgi:hypothetical protein
MRCQFLRTIQNCLVMQMYLDHLATLESAARGVFRLKPPVTPGICLEEMTPAPDLFAQWCATSVRW